MHVNDMIKQIIDHFVDYTLREGIFLSNCFVLFLEKLSCVLIGLGGGGLPNFLHHHIPQVKQLNTSNDQ